MAAPATSPLFATDATYTLDGDTWSGDPTKVNPGVGRLAEGYEPDLLPAEWLNFQLGLIGDWLAWGLGGGRSVSKLVSGAEIRGQNTLAGDLYSEWTASDSIAAGATLIDAAVATIPISAYLEPGATITQIVVRGLTSAASTDGMSFRLFKRNPSGGTSTQIGSTLLSGASSGAFILTLSGLSEVVDLSTNIYHVRVTSSDNASGSAGDFVYSVLVTQTWPVGKPASAP
jgi:hypothetical protein